MDLLTLLTLLALGAVALASAGVDGATVVVLDGSDWQLSPRLNSSAAGSRSAIKATVPGGVWDNLERAGRVGNPRYRTNDMQFFNESTGWPGGWTFTKTFDAPSSAAAATYVFELTGLQGLASIVINGQSLLSTDNMFRLYRVAVPDGVLRARGNTLSVHLAAAPPPVPFNGANPETVRARIEADAWGVSVRKNLLSQIC